MRYWEIEEMIINEVNFMYRPSNSHTIQDAIDERVKTNLTEKFVFSHF